MSKMFFIIGNPRSGTSLFRIMLNAHSSVTVPPECGFIQWWSEKYKNWTQIDSKDMSKVEAFISDLSNSKKIETWTLDYDVLEKAIYQNVPNNYAELCQLVIRQYGNQKGKDSIIFGDKNNYYINHLDLLSGIFPKAKFLGLVRDGRDVACSYLELKKLSINSPYVPNLPSQIDAIANEWVANNNRINDFFNHIPNNQFMWVRYEDLVCSTSKTLQRVCSFLDIDFEFEMLEYFRSQDEPKELFEWKRKTVQRPDTSNIGKFLQVLSKKEIELFNEISLKTLKNFDYL